MPTTPDCCDFDTVTNEELLSLLRNDAKNIVILDCRSSNEYAESHIREAVNFSIPSIMLRRLAAGKIDLASTIKSRDLKLKICNKYKENLFVLYNDLAGVQQHQNDSVLWVLLRRLTQDGCRVACLAESFGRFRTSFPEWCESCSALLETSSALAAPGQDHHLPLMGLKSLRISAPPLHRPPHRSCDSLSSAANSSTESSDTDDRCDSSLGLEDDKEFPVEILPYLFLGNEANSRDIRALHKHSIQYVLNVTPDLPNVFENSGSIQYMQIPITDHWSQNLASHFPKAIEFIEGARTQQKGVLVHCLAGVSRSVTITVAYLMFKYRLNLNDAYNVVRAKKSNISPNFNFMEQLYNYERELDLNVSSNSPPALMEQIKLEEEQQRKMQQIKGLSKTAELTATTASDLHRMSAYKKCQICGLSIIIEDEGSTGGGGGQVCKCRHPQPVSTTSTDFLSPLSIGVSPDSGIEFDRWASSTPAE